MEDKLIVSIGVITYNQEKYIKQCLDSIINQITNFNFEILINDDASTDGTTDIIKEYEQKYPNIIKPLYQLENQYSKNKGMLRNFILPRVQTKYFAICEGDDYWTDPHKLQKQVDFLESHPDYSVCFHPVKVTFDGYENMQDYLYPTQEQIDSGFSFENLLYYNFIQTNSVMYRWGFRDKDIKKFYPDGILPGDWYLHLLHAKVGKIGYLDETMAVYRRNPHGIWSDSINNVGKLHQKYALKEFKFYDSVYKYIADNSENYLNNVLIPSYLEITKWLIEFAENHKLIKAIQTYPEYFAQINFNNYFQINTQAIFLKYYRYKFLSKILFGKKKKHYKEKAEIYHEKVRRIRKIKENK